MIFRRRKIHTLGDALVKAAIILVPFAPFSQSFSQSIGNGALVSGLTAGAALRDPFAALNPSTAGSSVGAAVSIWTTRPYNLSDIRMFGLAGITSLWALGIAPRFRAIGFDKYKEFQTSIHLGLPITRRTDRPATIGFGIQARSRTAARGGLHTSYVLTTGLLIPMAPNIELGAVLSRSIDSRPLRIRTILVGLSFRLHENTMFYTDVFSKALFRPSYRLGMSTQPVRQIVLRWGASTNPDKVSAGVTIRAGPITGSIAVEYHLLLGATTTIETMISSPDS